MAHGRMEFMATLLPDGTVLVTGGGEGATGRTAEVYDPRTRTWTATGPMIEARQSSTATLLPNGTVLVTGGDAGSNGIVHEIASAELYNPISRTWSASAPMAVARRNHTATLLANGKVLVAGGIPDDLAAASAELYAPGTGN
jgi:hypothetical protein